MVPHKNKTVELVCVTSIGSHWSPWAECVHEIKEQTNRTDRKARKSATLPATGAHFVTDANWMNWMNEQILILISFVGFSVHSAASICVWCGLILSQFTCTNKQNKQTADQLKAHWPTFIYSSLINLADPFFFVSRCRAGFVHGKYVAESLSVLDTVTCRPPITHTHSSINYKLKSVLNIVNLSPSQNLPVFMN